MKTFAHIVIVLVCLSFIVQGASVALPVSPTSLRILRGCGNGAVVRNSVSTMVRLPTALQLTSSEKAAAGAPLKENNVDQKFTEASAWDMSYILFRNIAQNWGFPSLDKAPVAQVILIGHGSGKSFHDLCFVGIGAL